MSGHSGKPVSQKMSVRLVAEKNDSDQPTAGPSNGPPPQLTGALTVLGTGESCDVVLDSDQIDHAHTAIGKLGDGAYVCDLGAPGGTMINKKRIRWAKLSSGDVLAIGPLRFKVEVDAAEGFATEEQPVFRLHNEKNIGVITSIDPVLLIGSDPGCDIMLDEESVSPRHCLVAWTQEGPVLRDLQRRHLTRLNGRRIHSGRLMNGDSITIGRSELIFETDVKLPEPSRQDRQDGSDLHEWTGSTSGDSKPSEIISGRLPTDWTGKIEALWNMTRVDAQALRTNGKRKPAEEKESVRESGPTSAESISQESQEPPMVNDAKDKAEKDKKAPIEPLNDEATNVNSEHQHDDRSAQIRDRIAAAQQALDERARKYREGLDEERRKLEVRQAELQRQAKALRQAAMGGQPDVSDDDPVDEITPLEDLPGKSNIELLASGRIDLSSQSASNASENSSIEGFDQSVINGVTNPTHLEQRVAELVELAKTERTEIERGEAMIETLRLETERLRTTVARRQEKLQARRTNLEERFKALERTREVIRTEREPLAARLRKLDSEEASIQARMADGERIRGELDNEAELLNQAQQRLKKRQKELFDSLELERQRVQQRQSAMQVKTAELEQFLHSRLSDIEVELSARRADMETRPQPAPDAGLSLEPNGRGSHPSAVKENVRQEMSEQLSALSRTERQAAEGESRLDVLQKKIDALGSIKPDAAASNSTEPSQGSGGTRLAGAWKAESQEDKGLRMSSDKSGVGS